MILTETQEPFVRNAVLIAIISIAAVMIAAAVVPYFIPSSSYHGYIESKLAKHLYARVSIENVHFQVIPYPGYTIRNFVLVSKNPPFQSRPILQARKVKGSLSLWNLLRGKIVTSINIQDAMIDCLIAEGTNNISSLVSANSMQTGFVQTPPADDDFEIRLLKISNSRLAVSHEGAPVLTVEKFALSVENFSFSNAFGGNLKMTGRMFTPLSKSIAGDLSFTGQLALDTSRKEFSLHNIIARTLGIPFAADLSIGYATQPAFIDAKIASTEVSSLVLVQLFPFLGLNVPADLQWQGLVSLGASFKGSKDSAEAQLQMDAAPSKITIGNSFAKPPGVSLKGRADFLVQPGIVSIRDAGMNFGDQSFKIKGDILTGEGTSFNLNVAGEKLNAGSLKIFFPGFSIFDSLDNASVSMDVKIPPTSGEPLALNGTFGAKELSLAGIALSDVNGSFERMADTNGLSFSNLAATFDGGTLSANGSVNLDKPAGFNFDTVIQNLDSSMLSAAGGAIGGTGELKVKMESHGTDAMSLANNLKLTGTFSSPSPSWDKARPMEKLFNSEMWKILEENSQTAFSDEAKAKFAQLGESFQELEAPFETTDKGIILGPVSFSHPLYSAKLAATIDPTRTVTGDGIVRIPKEVSKQLAPPNIHKFLLDDKGEILLPVVVEGRMPEFSIRLDRDKLADILKQRPALQPKAGGQAPQPPKEVKKPAAKKEEKPKAKTESPPPKQKPKTPPPAPTPPREEKKAPVVSTPPGDDDILRVIIGR